MERRRREIDGGKFLVADSNPRRVRAGIKGGLDLQSFGRGGVGDEIDNAVMAYERTTPPILGNVAEHAMFNLVPLAGPRREVTDMDGDP